MANLINAPNADYLYLMKYTGTCTIKIQTILIGYISDYKTYNNTKLTCNYKIHFLYLILKSN